MTKTYPDVPGWTFEIDETSAGVYIVVARDHFGHVVSDQGTDVYALIEACKTRAKQASD